MSTVQNTPKDAEKSSSYLSVAVTRDLHKQLKIHAIEKNEPMAQLVARYIEEGIRNDSEAA